MSHSLPPIEIFNSLPREEFQSTINIIFESVPSLTSKLYEGRPYTSYSDLISKTEALVSSMATADKLSIINAHPRLGAPKSTLSDLSFAEQGYKSQNTSRIEESEIVNARLQELNQEYESKFGFRFVVFVNGRSRKDIIPIMEERMHNSLEIELVTGLNDMMDIARDRVRKMGLYM